MTGAGAVSCTAAQQTAAADVAACKAFYPECSDTCAPYNHDWTAGAAVYNGEDGTPATGSTRVLASSAGDASFAAWASESRNSKWNNSMCASTMEECCLIAAVEGWQCPVPSNADVITVMIGERRTLRLPPSPCDSTDTIPISGYNLITGETVVAHQVSICNTRGPTDGADVEQRYGCVHVDGRGLHSFPFPLNLSLLCPIPLNLSFTLSPI